MSDSEYDGGGDSSQFEIGDKVVVKETSIIEARHGQVGEVVSVKPRTVKVRFKTAIRDFGDATFWPKNIEHVVSDEEVEQAISSILQTNPRRAHD